MTAPSVNLMQESLWPLASILFWSRLNRESGACGRLWMDAVQAACEAVGNASCRDRLQTIEIGCSKMILKKFGTNVVSGSHSMGEVDTDGFAQTPGAASKSIKRRVQKVPAARKYDGV